MSKAFQFKKEKKKAKDLLGLQFYGETNQTLWDLQYECEHPGASDKVS